MVLTLFTTKLSLCLVFKSNSLKAVQKSLCHTGVTPTLQNPPSHSEGAFLAAIWLPHSQLWAIIEGATSLT